MTAVSTAPGHLRRGERIKIATLIVLTGVGGYVDAVSYLGLGRVFTAAMTGNTVLLALSLAAGDWSAVLRSAVALLGFVAGVALGQVVLGRFQSRKDWPRAAGSGLLIELVLLALLAVGWYLDGPRVDGPIIHLLIAASAVAMGVQSVTARQLGVAAVSTTYVTGTLTSLTTGTVEWFRSSERRRTQTREPGPEHPDSPVVHGPLLPTIAWGVYAASALAGAVAVMTAPAIALVPALLIVAILAFIDFHADEEVSPPLSGRSASE
jgi:uncharacterized membrane protein YoaK (UPF0700 family)